MLLSFLSDLYEYSNINKSDLLNGCNRLLLADSEGYSKVQSGTKTGPISAEAPSALLADLGSHVKSRSRLGLMFDVAMHAGK
jgi:hypothetical protein